MGAILGGPARGWESGPRKGHALDYRRTGDAASPRTEERNRDARLVRSWRVMAGFVQFGVDKLLKTWDTYARTTLHRSCHRMVRTNQREPVLLAARNGSR